MTKIAIMGCGPAGLLAAHAAKMTGVDFDIYSLKAEPSKHGGAQYLHSPIPGLTRARPDLTLRYIKLGDGQGYANKVYGDPAAPCSWAQFPEGDAPAWSMRNAYDQLWKMYGYRVMEQMVDEKFILAAQMVYDKVFSTVPLYNICTVPTHRFREAGIILTPDSKLEARNTIVYNGQLTEPWYRTSNIDGEQWTEYGEFADGPPIIGERHVGVKPTGTDCTCHPRVVRLGRFGQWQKGVLIHHVWQRARAEMGAIHAVH